MAFTAGELDNIANAALDFHLRGPALAQTLQDRPLYDAMRRSQKTFPGGKGLITKNVKAAYSTTVAGFTHNDTVSYVNPANIKQASYPWREHHAGISLTLTELKHDGISVVDSLDSRATRDHSDVEMTRLTGLLQDKLDDLTEGWARSFDGLLHDDGTGDAKALAGIALLVAEDPTTGTVGGINRATAGNEWWRNRAYTAAHALSGGQAAINTGTTSLALTMHKEMRQLRRYGGRPNLVIAGSDFLDALASELLDKGVYTQQGWSSSGATDISIADIQYKGLKFQYDPALDDLTLPKRCYVLDTRHLFPYVMEGEDMKRHSPARPYDSYVMYRAVTWTGNLFMDKANCHAVYDIA